MNSNVWRRQPYKKKTVKPTIAGLAHVPKVTGVIIAKLDTRIETTEPNLGGTCGGSWRWSTGIEGGGSDQTGGSYGHKTLVFSIDRRAFPGYASWKPRVSRDVQGGSTCPWQSPGVPGSQGREK